MTDMFTGLFPEISPWARVALWHDLVELALPDTAVEPELPTVIRQRLAPLLLRCLRQRSPDRLAEVRTELQADAFGRARSSMIVLERGAEICSRLEASGIEYAVAKGPSIAATYATWQDRPFIDLDLYVCPEEYARAIRRCSSWGLAETPSGRQPRRFADVACREAVNLKGHDGTSIDLHHHVPPWFWGQGLSANDLLATRRTADLLGHELHCVSPEDNLLIAALHVVSDKNTPGETLLIWRDVAQLAAIVDAERLARRADDCGLAWWLQRVLEELPQVVRPTELLERIASLGGQPPGRHRLAAMMSDRTRALGVGVTQPLRLPVGRALLFGAALAAPSREFLRHNFPGDPHPRRTWWKEAIGRRRADGSEAAA
jgi:Uncharacterised nucleotidyltransferase